ncbi:hypothetical protein IIA15_08515 [candidate division TA06 bacterium]|nr:hypothetical protein [candidate division TA06 bacterium]
MKRTKLFLIGFGTMVVMGFFPMEARGIPAFARKYKTSCVTCHVAFPKLNAFGDAFRRNGFQFPEKTDPQYAKEEPVPMGAEAQKKVFPDAIWPGAIPHLPPIALVIESEVKYFPEAEDDEVKLSFDDFAGEVELLAGGTVGEDISFYGEVEFTSEGEAEIERVYAMFDNLISPSALYVKVGKFEPGVFTFSNHRRLAGPAYWILKSGGGIGDNKWSLEGEQKGLEASGIISGVVTYNAGLVEGRKNLLNTEKDFYGHLGAKIGGLRLDGVTEGSPSEESRPWVDNAVQFGGFAYVGTADLGTMTGVQEDPFTMFGGDVNVSWEGFNLLGAIALESHDQPLAANPTVGLDATFLLAEGSYVVFPWLIPSLRFENFKTKLADIDSTWAEGTRIVPALKILLRANVQVIIVVEVEEEDDAFKVEEVEAALILGF